MPTMRGILVAAIMMALAASSAHTGGTDVVEVKNGDRFTGDVSGLYRGKLAFRTDAAGTIDIAWDQVVSLTSTQNLDVELTSGKRYSGTITMPSPGQLVVQTDSGPTPPLDAHDVVRLTSIVSDFQDRMSGSIDFGWTFLQENSAVTRALNAEAAHSSLHWETEGRLNSWVERRDDADRESRNDVTIDTRRLFSMRWFGLGMFEALADERMGVDWRLVAAVGGGRRLIQSHRNHFSLEGGLAFNIEEYEDESSTDRSFEVMAGLHWDLFAGNRTTAAVVGNTYLGLDRQRLRAELDGNVHRSLVGSLYLAGNMFGSYDSDPPIDAPRSDIGASIALGWSF
ncbi:MAG: DUF481 domain-containing protein [Candidatus Polarisedimenticolia bacterium]